MAVPNLRKSKPGYLKSIEGIVAPLSFLALLVLVLSFALRKEGFLTLENWKNIVQATAVVAILAIGQTAVIIAGEIDLSVGQIASVAGCVAAWAMVSHGVSLPLGVLIACCTGALCGVVNGLLRAYGKMPSFIVTLGMMGVANGLALKVAGGQNIRNLPEGISYFSRGELFGGPTTQGIPIPLILILVAAIIVHLILSRTAWGRKLYAVGGNRDAARLAGISIPRTMITVFLLSGLMAGFAAVVQVSRSGIAQPTGGAGLELRAIAATVIGGTSLAGGQGAISGTLIGAFLMAVIQNGCDLKVIEPYYQLIIIGAVIWLAALYDGMRRGGR